MKGNYYHLVLPIVTAALLLLIGAWVSGATGIDFISFASNNVLQTLGFFVFGLIVGWVVLSLVCSGRFVYKGFSEKEELEKQIKEYDNLLTDVQSELARCKTLAQRLFSIYNIINKSPAIL